MWDPSQTLWAITQISALERSGKHLVWLSQLEGHLNDKTPKYQILLSLLTLIKVVDFIFYYYYNIKTDAAINSLRLSARSAALFNSVRRFHWLLGKVTKPLKRSTGHSWDLNLVFP